MKRSPMRRAKSQKVLDYEAELDALTPALLARAGMACELRIPGVCLGAGGKLSRSHRKSRGQGGENTMENVMIACGDGVTGCHGHIESHRTEAYEKGWLVKSYDDPALIEVKR